jgi:hypothetical protein
MTKSIALPTNAQELRSMLVTGIEFFQGSPVKNQNKINEALAKALGFDNYDQLSPLIAKEPSVVVMDATINSHYNPNGYCGSYIEINDIEINDIIFDKEMVDYRLIDREDFIKELYQWISETDDSDRGLMIEDQDYLKTLDDKFIFSSIITNEYISPTSDPDEFNEICLQILELNKSFIGHEDEDE